ncbi:MAG: hypothetical protein AAF546_09395 [Verrucomicrobiota bacterium]
MKTSAIIISLLLVSICTVFACGEKEREAYLENNDLKLSDFKMFNLTSPATELFYELDRLKLIEAAKRIRIESDPDHTEKELEELRDYFLEAKQYTEEKWKKLKEGVPAGASLFLVDLTNDEGPFTGYYFILNGLIVKEDLYKW